MKIGTAFEISYAHRIMNHPGKCKDLHGHNGRVEIQIEAPVYLESGMVMDFGILKGTVKDWIIRHFDHVTILQEGDSLLETVGDRLVVVSHPPTAELISNILVRDGVVGRLNGNLTSATVRFWETADCYAESHSDEAKVFPWSWDMR